MYLNTMLGLFQVGLFLSLKGRMALSVNADIRVTKRKGKWNGPLMPCPSVPDEMFLAREPAVVPEDGVRSRGQPSCQLDMRKCVLPGPCEGLMTENNGWGWAGLERALKS